LIISVAPIVQWPRISGSHPGDRGSTPLGGIFCRRQKIEQVNIRAGEQWRRKEFKKNVFVRFTCGQLLHCSTVQKRDYHNAFYV
jgi:hypothetical protein